MAAQSMIQFRGISKSFGSVLALDRLDFSVNAGEVHCLLGDNGAGKSTLIKIMSGVYRPTRGEYLIDGQPTLLSSPRDALDRGIATVYQDLAVAPALDTANGLNADSAWMMARIRFGSSR